MTASTVRVRRDVKITFECLAQIQLDNCSIVKENMAKLADELCHEVTSSKLLGDNGGERAVCQRGRVKEEITDPLVILEHENCSWEKAGSDSG